MSRLARVLPALALATCARDPGPGAVHPPRVDEPRSAAGEADHRAADTGPLEESLPGDSGVGVVLPRLLASGPVACPDPATTATGRFVRTTFPVPVPPKVYLAGAGSVVADLDDDGRLDVVAVGVTQALIAWQEADGFAPPVVLLEEAPGSDPMFGLFGGAAADYDDDGDLDLLISGYGVPDHLLRNEGGRAFVEVTRDAGLVHGADHMSTGVTWHDVNGDGRLDVLLAGHTVLPEALGIAYGRPGDPTLVYVNQGDGTFVDETWRIDPGIQRGLTFVSTFLDVDQDGDDDLYQANDFGSLVEPCRLLWNDGTGRFVADLGAYGMDAPVAAMGVAVGDLDGDGDEDLGVAAWDKNRLYDVDLVGAFERAQAVGWWPRRGQTVGWGSEAVDVNNDGWLDLSTAYGFLDTAIAAANERVQPDALYLQQAGGVFVDRAPAHGLDDGAPTRSHNWADLDGNGWLDLVRVNLAGEAWIDLAECALRSWITVRLRQPAPNVHAVGATVRVTAGGRTQLRRVRAGGSGYATGGPPQVHFGLREAEVVELLEVTWPDGTVTRFTDVDARRHLTVTR